jgi:hypothetical protein
MVLPESVRPAWYILTGIFGGPFTFGVNYWLGGKLKPFFSVNHKAPVAVARTAVEKEVERLGAATSAQASAAESPFKNAMEGIGAASTGLSDPFKDGRNITKDSEINPRDSMNDAAFRLSDEEDARATLAGAILYQATTYPEAKINSMLAFLLHMKLKQRFGNPDSYASVQGHIRKLAARENLNPEQALSRLDQVIGPELWPVRSASRSEKSSKEADEELHSLLLRARVPSADGVDLETKVAWAALFYERHYAGVPISQATSFEFYMGTKDRLANAASYDRALEIVRSLAPQTGVTPEAATERLNVLFRRDLWSPLAVAAASADTP